MNAKNGCVTSRVSPELSSYYEGEKDMRFLCTS